MVDFIQATVIVSHRSPAGPSAPAEKE